MRPHHAPLLAILLAACGDDSNATTSESTSTDSPTTTSPTTGEPTPTTVPTTAPDPTTSDPTTGAGTTTPLTATDSSSTGDIEPTTSTTTDSSTSTTTSTTTDTSTSTDSSTTADTSTSTGDPDAIAPTLTLTAPQDGAYVPMRQIPLRGLATDDTGIAEISVSIDDGPSTFLPIAPAPEVEFTATITLHRGWNKLTVRAHDAADNIDERTIEIHLGIPIAGGGAHSLAILDDIPYGFGRNNEGQLGLGDTSDRHTPVALAGPAQIVSLAANLNHSLALDEDGTVHAWGRNEEQQLGKGPGPDGLTPQAVAGLADVVAISAGQRHSLALTADGVVWSWGANADGQLGRAGEPGTAAPIAGLADVVAIAGGGSYSLAATASGALWAWGNNGDGQLGTDSYVSSPIPVLIAEPGAIQIATGKAHSLSLDADGSALAWGLDAQGQLGDGASGDDSLTPNPVLALTQAQVLAASGNHSVAYADDGALWIWGANFSGQLGLGDLVDRPTPELHPLADIRAVAPGLAHTLVRKADGTIWIWGLNSFGQLGDANQGTNSLVPLQVSP